MPCRNYHAGNRQSLSLSLSLSLLEFSRWHMPTLPPDQTVVILQQLQQQDE
ncbi:hypothetical protein HU200_023205 [Digitaria exilis]|uniref:Uncharacterized protein n=1 Tax=Digitaria exilis TaxID=1010633 RepID=A0A835EUM1_9POAL|nr:hypothetical protein HU200_023205 [Digitaria exilis]CAB3502003.1 unnamed protein product [Digitaria exilis]